MDSAIEALVALIGALGLNVSDEQIIVDYGMLGLDAVLRAKRALAAIRSGKVLVRSAPVKFPEIVCLCGSTRFMQAFFEAGWEFTLQGKIVLSVGVCKHSEHHGAEALGQDVADRLDELHKRKIDLADSVFVLNVDGYIGDSTRSEIEYAKSLGKPIAYLHREEPAND